MKTINEIQAELKELVPQGIDLTLQAVKGQLAKSTDTYKDLLLLEGRYQDVTRQLLQGTLANEDAQLAFNRIRKDLLDFIDRLKTTDLASAATATGDGRPDVYNGELLYRIPPTMTINQEVKCTVRLAFDRKVVLADFELQPTDVLKDIRIAEVMGVELLDPSAQKAFDIRTLNDTVQFVDQDLYTEWIFYVKPILEGVFPLVLKISIIEIHSGIERKRNVTLEETVEIVSKPAPQAGGTDGFSNSGFSMQVARGSEEQRLPGGGKGIDPPRVQPNSPAPAPPQPTAPSPSTRGNFRKLGAGLASLVVLVVASWAIWSNMRGNKFTGDNPATEIADATAEEWNRARKNNSRKDYEDFIKNNPEALQADSARHILNEMEQDTWEAAIASNDQAALQKYLDEYPEGRYRTEAMQALEALAIVKEEEPLPTDPVKPDEPVKQQPTKNAKPKPNQNAGNKPDKTTKNNQPNTKNNNPKPPIRPAPPEKTTPEKETKKTDPNTPVPLRLVARKPFYRNCNNDNDRLKEQKCTEDKIRSFLKKRLRYPEAAEARRIEGTVNTEFVVERDGSVTEVKYLDDIGGGCAQEAVRLVKMLPKFEPGADENGRPMRVRYSLPIRFALE